ncbi:MAG: hypothetical protein IT369_10935 [Candidatus Latescibacteria bacterium]|nr:hypothetical protein [Candidatus Latescibacterota bacterium]
MDSIFPGLGPNPFNTKPLVDYFNTGRKAGSANNSQATAGYPAPNRRSESRPVGTPAPGRGQLIDYMA